MTTFQKYLAELVDTLDGKNGNGSSNNNGSRKPGERRKVTLKTFRDFVKPTISDLGYFDFSDG